ncbi:hypothetical protein C8Q75DRAFT_539325 [Abortiporus biennis]|nr:hypothetical protein C8Q75DRAFT_539325 [Abortiporus biennis]
MNLLHFIGFIVAAASSTVFAFQGIDIDKPRHTLEVRELCGTQDVLDRNYEAGARASHFASHDAGHHQLEYYQHDTREVVDLELREIVDELLRRAEAAIIRRNVVTKRGTLRGGFLKKKMFRKRTPINISWRPNAVKDLNDPLSATWKPGEDAKKKHEDIIKDHAKNVPGAVTAKIM